MSRENTIPRAKVLRARQLVEQARGILAAACLELAPVGGAVSLWKTLARREEDLFQAIGLLDALAPGELKHPVTKGCPCGCGELAARLEQHSVECPAFRHAMDVDFDPEMCDPEVCAVEQKRIAAREAAPKAVAS